MASDRRTLRRGDTDLLEVRVANKTDLVDQEVLIGFDDAGPWHPATWSGIPGPKRIATLLVSTDNMPAPGLHDVFVRLVDGDESVTLHAGSVTVR
ncbi:hypothetical protein G5V59_27080 [Nocardioides sp. W3-2-3]|uniref:hypothetical protein n=1 Tax=Nocardioides convexus TaxID=2712224 RepID=UPI00241876DA|nr:hypothetical protein [Nocardioides convexus]NHA02057.1 hypothetical protein [Nocardioides convexus]